MGEINKEVIDEVIEDPCLIAYHEIINILKEILKVLKGAVLEEKKVDSVITTKKDVKTLKSTTNRIFDYSIKHETDKAILIQSNTTKLVTWIIRKGIKFMDDTKIELHDWMKSKINWQEDQVF